MRPPVRAPRNARWALGLSAVLAACEDRPSADAAGTMPGAEPADGQAEESPSAAPDGSLWMSPADATRPSVQPSAPDDAADAGDAAVQAPRVPRTLAELAAHPLGRELDPAPEAPGGRGQLVTLRAELGASLSIGTQGPFAYPGGALTGTLTDLGEGRAELFLPAESAEIPPLLFIPGIDLVRVDITPRDMRGLVDFCTGAVELPFDARFQPVMLGFPQSPLSVVTLLTTGTVQGKNTPERTLTGTPLSADGALRLVGIADVPKTGDPGVDDFLGLPADARTDMPSRLELTEGAPDCP